MDNYSYRPHYHAHVSSGWCNDPNGMIMYGGRAHLFFQHYPYKAEWGTMHWGHFSTEDFIHWKEEEIALRPDEEYEDICGCCSGNAVEKDGKLWLMYTAAQPDRQRQCLAYSQDGVHFTKLDNNPILTADMLDCEVAGRDFRDPKVFMQGGIYYCLTGTRIIDPDDPMYLTKDGYLIKNISGSFGSEHTMVHGNDTRLVSGAQARAMSSQPVLGGDYVASGYGNMILFSSKDLLNWEYKGKLLYRQEGFDEQYFTLDGVYECPDYIRLDGHDIILASPQNLPQMDFEYENLHSTLYLEGSLSYDTGRFVINSVHEVDAGFDFYAAQCWHTDDGRVIMLAWKEMWDRSYPSRDEGWVGTYTLPRELTFKDGHLYQQPVREIEQFRRNEATVSDIELSDSQIMTEELSGSCCELLVRINPGNAKKAGVKLFCGGEHETLVYYDAKLKAVVFDRSRSGIPITGRDEDLNVRHCFIEAQGELELHIFLDVSSVEVFINNGKYAMSGNVYPDADDIHTGFFSEGTGAVLIEAKKYDIIV